MNALVLGCLTDATGNATTARRIAAHLMDEHRVTLVNVSSLSGINELREIVRAQRIDFAVGVHALLSGPFLRAIEVPYALVFGGTDLYEEVYELQLRQMTTAVEGAALCVAFSHRNGERAQELWPMVRGKLRCIPQAVDVGGAQAFNLRGALGLDGAARVVLLPTGLRRVKDPTFVVEAMAAWHEEDPSVHLVVCGAELEPGFAEQARAALTGRRGIHFVGPLSRSVLLSAMRQADVVLNTSVSEGMCGALMEAMAVGTPVLARRNAGNRSLITHGINGFLFDTPAEFRQLAQRLLDSPGSAQLLRQHARGRIEREHSVEREKFQYLGVAASLGEDRFFSAVAR